MFSRISSYLKQNSTKILSVICILAVLGLIGYTIYQSLNYISGLRGFNFDPFLLIGIVLFSSYFQAILKNQNQILSKQQILLEKLLAQNVNLKASVSRPKQATIRKVVTTKKK